MFCSLISIKKDQDRLITIRIICFVTVQDSSKTSPANAIHPLGTPNFSNVIGIDDLSVKNSEINAAFFDNQRVKLAEKRQILITERSQ